MRAVRRSRRHLQPLPFHETMIQGRRPQPGPFFRRGRAIEAVGAEFLVDERHGRLRALTNPGPRRDGDGLEVPVVHETGRLGHLRRQAHIHRAVPDRESRPDIDEPMFAGYGRKRRRLRAAPRDQVNRASEGVGAKGGRARSQQHLHPFDLIQCHGEVGVVMPGLRVVDAHTVNQHEHLAKPGAPHGEVRLHAPRPARPHIDAGDESHQIGDGAGRQPLDVLSGDHTHGPGQFAEGHRQGAAGDDDRFDDTRRDGLARAPARRATPPTTPRPTPPTPQHDARRPGAQ